ncbi:hypothetical protein GCM10020358_51180 [Amorphoplanes nipponensis]
MLRRVGLRLAPGERVALVGSTGAGKTTVASIAAGVLRPAEGEARVGGVPVPQLPAGTVAIISQETHVFAGPLIEDLRLARPEATAEEVSAALATVNALAWARALPEGLDTLVGDGGHELTPAQAQQLALARLVLLDPVVAVLDEATAEAGSAGARSLEEAAAAATPGADGADRGAPAHPGGVGGPGRRAGARRDRGGRVACRAGGPPGDGTRSCGRRGRRGSSAAAPG